MKRKSVLAALLCFLVFFTVTPVLADEVPAAAVSVPIYACTRITSLPYTINTPGYYYVAGNLSVTDSNGITVNCNDVTIDLMGFCLTGTNCGPSGAGYSAVIFQGKNNVEVRNGSIVGWRGGIEDFHMQGNGNRAINVRFRNCCWGTYLGTNALVKECTAIDLTNDPSWGFCLSSGKVINCVP